MADPALGKKGGSTVCRAASTDFHGGVSGSAPLAGRLYLGMHSPVDLAAGLIVGLLLTGAWCSLHAAVINFLRHGQNGEASQWACPALQKFHVALRSLRQGSGDGRTPRFPREHETLLAKPLLRGAAWLFGRLIGCIPVGVFVCGSVSVQHCYVHACPCGVPNPGGQHSQLRGPHVLCGRHLWLCEWGPLRLRSGPAQAPACDVVEPSQGVR